MPSSTRRSCFLPLAAAAVLAAGEALAARAEGPSGAVAAEHRLASEAGLSLLRAGGNAVDAAVAALLAGGVVNPSSSGLGGGGFMVLFRAADRSIHTVDFRETAPAAATRDMFVRDRRVDTESSKRGGLAVAVPGEAAGLAYVLERFGTVSLSAAAAPAVRLARDGFAVEAHLAAALARHRDELASDPGLAADLLRTGGQPYREGEILRRPALAATLSALATNGPVALRGGSFAADVVAAVRNAGGVLTADDLASYSVVEREPILTSYRGLKIAGMPPPSAGGGTIGAALEILEAYRLPDFERDGPTYLHLLAETLKAVFADRAQRYGDPAFVAVPLQTLLSPGRAAKIRAGFRATGLVPPSAYGATAAATDAGTTNVAVIDAQGNAVAATSSINTAFGAKIGVRGIVLNNTMDDFSLQPGVPNAYGLVGSEANSIRPGKRPVSSMSPTIVLEGQHVRLAAGGSGGPLIISATLQTLLATVDFGLDVDAAVAAARIHHQWAPDVLLAEPGIPPSSVASLERIGHGVKTVPSMAAVSAVSRERADAGTSIVASSDERKGGRPAAY